MSKWRKQVKKLQGAVKRWRKQWLRDGKRIEKLCAQINDLTSREAAALNQAEQYRRQALEIDKKAKGDLRVKEDEVRRMRESRDAWTRSYNESRILRDQAVAEMNRAVNKAQGHQPSAGGGVDVNDPPHDWTAVSSPADKSLVAELRKCLEIVQTSLLQMTRLARIRRGQVQGLRWLVDNEGRLAHRRLSELWETRHERDMLLAERDELRDWQKRVCHAWVGFEYRDLPAAKHLDQAIKSGPDV